MTPCRKCGHPLSKHDVYDGCRHRELRPFGKRTCICSGFRAENTRNCPTCRSVWRRDK
jgi:hypothetical protein